MSVFADLVAHLADLLQPLFHASATAVAIVLFTALVRLLVHPLSRAAARGQRARIALQPQIAELRKKHAKNPERLQKALLELHTKEKVSPLSGCLPSLCQLPAFFLLYHLFSNTTIGGEANALLTHRLFAAPLGDRWADALAHGGVLGAQGLVYVGLFVIVTGVAAFNFRRTKRMMAAGTAGVPAVSDEQLPGMAASMGAVSKFMPFLSFFTLVTVAVVPLAAALYVVTSTTWTAVERAVLYPLPEAETDGAAGAGAEVAAAKTGRAAKTAKTAKTDGAAKTTKVGAAKTSGRPGRSAAATKR